MGTIPVAVSVYEKLALARLELVAEEVLRSRCADIVPDFRLDWDYFCRWPLPDKLALAASPGACDWLERTQIYIDQGLFDRYAAQYASRHLKNFCALLLFFLSETRPSPAPDSFGQDAVQDWSWRVGPLSSTFRLTGRCHYAGLSLAENSNSTTYSAELHLPLGTQVCLQRGFSTATGPLRGHNALLVYPLDCGVQHTGRPESLRLYPLR